MQFIGPDVATTCVGEASSAAAILLAGGSPGKRSMLPHARVVLRQPQAAPTQGSMSDLAIEAAELERLRGDAEALIARHTGREIRSIRADIERDLVLRGRDAIDYGVIDRVLDDR